MITAGLVALGCLLAPGGVTVVREWRFDRDGDLQGWLPNGHLTDVSVAGGRLRCRTTDWDPFFTSVPFEFAARPWQQIELRLSASAPGEGEIFWSGTLEGEHGGFSGGKSTRFVVRGGGLETIRLEPFWQAEGRIVHLRLDLYADAEFAIESIRIIEPPVAEPVEERSWRFAGLPGGWSLHDLTPQPGEGLTLDVDHPRGRLQSPPLALEAAAEHWLVLRLSSRGATQAEVLWAADALNGLQRLRFGLRSDGRSHVYNLDLGGEPNWQGNILALALQPSNVAGAEVTVESITIQDEPGGEADLELQYFGHAEAVNRVGSDCWLTARLLNHGAEAARGLDWSLDLPAGVTLVRQERAPEPVFEFEYPVSLRLRVVAERPVDDGATFRYRLPGGPELSARMRLQITPALGLPAAEVVPPPRPAATDYRIGSYYFPGWGDPTRWEPIDRVAPIRRPVLGWYDEALPEVADWQIKWALEHGVSFFLVDWYWSQGNRHLEHWLHDAFFQSRYHDQFEWAIMWANHNAPDTHSVEDWRAVTAYWIEHYLHRDDYLRIDGKPAVFIWAPSNIRRDVGGSEQAAALYAMSQEMAREAGLPGIYFVSMNAQGRAAFAQLREEGYQAATSYHGWFGAPQVADDPRYFPFSLVVDQSPAGWAQWRAEAEAGGLRYLPIADSGWDARPWHGNDTLVIHDRTVDEFERLLRAAKTYLDEQDEKLLILGPWNEWGEGSYLEPCLEYGFGMLQAIRRVFGRDPAPPIEVTPVDVGLGPYDFPDFGAAPRTAWDFADSSQGWGAMMGLGQVAIVDGALQATSASGDPAFAGPAMNVLARSFSHLVVRMKLERPEPGADRLQVFWTTSTRGTSEATSFSVEARADGQWHTYVLPLADKVTWRGMIRSFRLDPCSTVGTRISIDRIELTNDPPAAD